MLNLLERFFNWQMDMDWSWGPLIFLRPARDERLTARFWLKLFVAIVVFSAPLSVALGGSLAYYDAITPRQHHRKATPVAAAEAWMNATSPGTVLFYFLCGLVFVFLYCFPTHWAWNRRADRLNREPHPLTPPPAAAPGVWPPPPSRT